MSHIVILGEDKAALSWPTKCVKRHGVMTGSVSLLSLAGLTERHAVHPVGIGFCRM